jgi:hypothetical protein
VRSGPGKTAKNKKKKKYSGQQQKEIDCDEPHPSPNEKTKPIQWTERPTGALVAVNSLWPFTPHPSTCQRPRMPLTKQYSRFPFLFLPRTQREPARGRGEKQQEDVTERWWATNPKENVSSCVFMVLCSREESMI